MSKQKHQKSSNFFDFSILRSIKKKLTKTKLVLVGLLLVTSVAAGSFVYNDFLKGNIYGLPDGIRGPQAQVNIQVPNYTEPGLFDPGDGGTYLGPNTVNTSSATTATVTVQYFRKGSSSFLGNREGIVVGFNKGNISGSISSVSFMYKRPNSPTWDEFVDSSAPYDALILTDDSSRFPNGEYEFLAQVSTSTGVVSTPLVKVNVFRIFDLTDNPVPGGLLTNPFPDSGGGGVVITAEPARVTPSVTYPANNSLNIPVNPTIRWSSNASNLPNQLNSYTLQVSKTTDFAFPVIERELAKTVSSFAVPNGTLDNGTIYYLRVVANNVWNGNTVKNSSTLIRFTTVSDARPVTPNPNPVDNPPVDTPPNQNPPTNPSLVTPLNNATSVSVTPTFVWDRATTATGYALYVSPDATINEADLIQSTGFTTNSGRVSFTLPASRALQADKVYYWNVAAFNSGGSSMYQARSFRTAVAVTNPPNNNLVTKVNFVGSSERITESNRDVTVTARLDRALAFQLEVPITLRQSSTARVSDNDFELPARFSFVFAPGETSASIRIKIISDTKPEFDETIILKLAAFNFPASVEIGSNDTYTITILDNDGGLPGSVIPGSRVSCERYFIDVDRFDPLCEQVAYLYERGIFRGQSTSSGNRADLSANLKRSEYFAIATRLLGRESNSVRSLNVLTSRFRDLNPSIIADRNNNWWLTAVAQLEGIVRGFGPEGQKTLEAARVTTEAEIAKVALEGKFLDFSNRDFIAPWYTDTTEFMARYSYYIDPARSASRADAVEILYVILQIEADRNYYRNFLR